MEGELVVVLIMHDGCDEGDDGGGGCEDGMLM